MSALLAQSWATEHRARFFLVGQKGEVTYYFRDFNRTHKLTPDGLPSEAQWIVCFPEHDHAIYTFDLFTDSRYYWVREIEPLLAEEALSLGYFELVSWYKFIEESIWWHQAKRHMRDTWEVTPDIPHERDYSILDQIDRFDEGPTYLGEQEGDMEDWIPMFKPGRQMKKRTVDILHARA